MPRYEEIINLCQPPTSPPMKTSSLWALVEELIDSLLLPPHPSLSVGHTAFQSSWCWLLNLMKTRTGSNGSDSKQLSQSIHGLSMSWQHNIMSWQIEGHSKRWITFYVLNGIRGQLGYCHCTGRGHGLSLPRWLCRTILHPYFFFFFCTLQIPWLPLHFRQGPWYISHHWELSHHKVLGLKGLPVRTLSQQIFGLPSISEFPGEQNH